MKYFHEFPIMIADKEEMDRSKAIGVEPDYSSRSVVTIDLDNVIGYMPYGKSTILFLSNGEKICIEENYNEIRGLISMFLKRIRKD